MPCCYVPGCKHVSRRETCRFFRFPANKEVFKKWKAICPPKNRAPTRNDRICSCHFADENDLVPSIFEPSSNKRSVVSQPEALKSSTLKVQAIDNGVPVETYSTANVNMAMSTKDSMEECRACLQKIENQTAYNLFEAWFTPWAVRGAVIAHDLSKFADVEILECDKFSKVICPKCYHRLSDACKFMITVQMSDSILRQRSDESNITSTPSEVGITWPQPILLNKNGNVDNRMEIEVKQEVLSEDENNANVEQDWEPMMDIKIEPEEISAPVQSNIQVNGGLDEIRDEITNFNGSSNKFEQEEYLDSTVKQEPQSGDDLLEAIPELPLDCMLCFKVFNSVSGLKAHVISQHSYKAVKRKAESCPSPAKNKIPAKQHACNSCDQSFVTSTDLMVHRASHSEHVCYVCDRKFNSFKQLTRHGPRCQKKCALAARRDHTRPPPRPQQLSQPVKNTTNAPKQDRTGETKTPSIEDIVVESVQELVEAWPSTEVMDIDSSRTESKNELKSKVQIGLLKEQQKSDVINEETVKIEIEPTVKKEQESVLEPKPSPPKVEIEESVEKPDDRDFKTDKPDNKLLEPENKLLEPENKLLEPENKLLEPENKLLEPENMLLEPEYKQLSECGNKLTEPENNLIEPENKLIESKIKLPEPENNLESENKLLEPEIRLPEPEKLLELEIKEPKLEQIQKRLQTQISHEELPAETMEENQGELISELTVDPLVKVLETVLSQKLDSSSDNIPSISTPEPTKYSKTLSSTIIESDDNSLLSDLDVIVSLSNEEKKSENISPAEEPSIEPHNFCEEIEPCNVQESSLNKNQDNSNVPEKKIPAITEISEMNVHLAINPLDKNVLFDTEMEVECGKTESCDSKIM